MQSASSIEKDAVEGRKGSYEMYGYDFMCDENNNVWLIEVISRQLIGEGKHLLIGH